MTNFGLTMTIVAACVPLTARAETKEILQPIQIGDETVRFDRGDYVIDLVGQRSAVRVESMPSDHGNLSFVVAVLNTGPQPVNVDTSNIRVAGTAENVRILTRADMEHKAVHRAGWSKFLTGLGGAVAATALASQRDYYSATTRTPFRTYSTQFSAPCWSCQAAASDTLAATRARITRIQGALDNARQELGEQALQLTTIYPGQSYGGRIFLDGFKHEMMGQMRLIVSVGGESFTFGFRFAPEGTPTPAYRMAALPPQPVSQPSLATAYAPPLTASAAQLPTASTNGSLRYVSVTAETRLAPAPRTAKPLLAGANSAASVKWHRYYDTLIQSNIPKHDARVLADQEFGAID